MLKQVVDPGNNVGPFHNIDRMCIKHHTHCSVESVVERGTSVPSLSSVCGTGRWVVETRTSHVSVQDIEVEDTFCDDLKNG
jgi:hypothetical protein